MAVSTDYVIEVLSEIEELIKLACHPYIDDHRDDAEEAVRNLKKQIELGQESEDLAVSTDYVIEVLSEIEELIELIYSPYGQGAYKSDAKKAARRLKAQLEIGQKLD